MPKKHPHTSKATQWREEGLCPQCGENPLGVSCSHLAAAYDRTFPSPNGESLCPLELGGIYCDATCLDTLTQHLLRLLLLLNEKKSLRPVANARVRHLSGPLVDLVQFAMTDKCAGKVAWEDGRFTFDSDVLLRLFRKYVDTVFEATPGYLGSGSGEAGGPGFASEYVFHWAETGSTSADTATQRFEADALRIADLLKSLEQSESGKSR